MGTTHTNDAESRRWTREFVYVEPARSEARGQRPTVGAIGAWYRAMLITRIIETAHELVDQEGLEDRRSVDSLGEACSALMDVLEDDRRAGLIRLVVEAR